MPSYVALLRAINVTGRFIKMVDLSAHFAALGYADARTFINSGNVTFSSRTRSADALARGLEAGLEPLLGFKSEVFVRGVPDMRAIVQRAAALRSQVSDGGDLNVIFSAKRFTSAQREAVLALRSEHDEWELGERELYWLSRLPQHLSKVSNAVLERRLKCRLTLRRASMLQRLATQLAAPPIDGLA